MSNHYIHYRSEIQFLLCFIWRSVIPLNRKPEPEADMYTNIDIGKYRLSGVTAILISDIGIGQNFHIGASLFILMALRCAVVSKQFF